MYQNSTYISQNFREKTSETLISPPIRIQSYAIMHLILKYFALMGIRILSLVMFEHQVEFKYILVGIKYESSLNQISFA